MKKELLLLTSLPFLLFGMAMRLNAQPEFAEPISDPFGLVYEADPGQSVWVRLVDIDGDDTLEAFIFKVNPDGPCCGEIEYYENGGSNADPEFVPADYSSFGIIENPVIVPWQFVDIDGDGDFDLTYFVFAADTPLRILWNKGTATSPEFEGPFEENPYGITLPASDLDPSNLLDGVTPFFADLDMDCDLDLMYNGAINGQPDDAYFFSENTGTFYYPSYAAPVRNDYGITFPGGNYHQSIFVDLDCDGDLDLYTIIAPPDGNLRYYENTPDANGGPQFITPPKLWYPVDSVDYRFLPETGAFFDHGGDGDLDLICGGGDGIFFWENISPDPDSCGYRKPKAGFSYTQNDLEFTFTDESTGNPTDWFWSFGDFVTSTEQNPTHVYFVQGEFKVCLEVSNEFGCHGVCQDVTIPTGIRENEGEVLISLAPNPVQDELQLTLRSQVALKNAGLGIFNPVGRQVFADKLETTGNELNEKIDLSRLTPGLYLLKIRMGENTLVRKFVKTD